MLGFLSFSCNEHRKLWHTVCTTGYSKKNTHKHKPMYSNSFIHDLLRSQFWTLNWMLKIQTFIAKYSQCSLCRLISASVDLAELNKLVFKNDFFNLCHATCPTQFSIDDHHYVWSANNIWYLVFEYYIRFSMYANSVGKFR